MPIRVKGQTSDRHPRREWNSPERRKKRQEEYMEKHGPQEPRRKRLATEDKYKEVREKLKDRGGFKPLRAAKAAGSSVGKTKGPKGTGTRGTIRDRLKDASKRYGRKSLYESAGGGVKAKPHSTKEGRTAAGKRRVGRILKQLKPKTMEQRPLPKWPKQPKKIPATRNAYGLGSLVKKGISKILKPKGVFKPKPVPKAVTDKPIGWSPKGEYTKADDKKITSILKKLGDEIKAAPLPPKLKATLKKAQKASPHKKAEGGRIGLKHGGSVGAAVRGHGAEIK